MRNRMYRGTFCECNTEGEKLYFELVYFGRKIRIKLKSIFRCLSISSRKEKLLRILKA